MPVKWNCSVCGEEKVTPPSQVGKYCSSKCRQNRVTKICPICNKQFEVTEANKDKRTTCGKECYGKLVSQRQDSKLTKNCVVCGKEFKTKPSHYEIRKTCSHKCSGNLKVTEEIDIGSIVRGRTYDESYSWKSGKRIHNGYVYVRQKDGSEKGEHRLVMEKEIGRELYDYEHVHHVDENKLNNNPRNLMLMSNKAHLTYHNKRKQYIHIWETLLKVTD